MTWIKKPLWAAMVLLPVGGVAGLFAVQYAVATYGPVERAALLAAAGGYTTLLVVGTIQAALVCAACGFFGWLLAEKTGLLKPLRFTKATLGRVVPGTLVMGLAVSMDYWVFGRFLPQVAATYESPATVAEWVTGVLYGGIVEEVLMRLFVMSLLSFVLWKAFARGSTKEGIPAWVYMVASLMAALLFAAGHLPTTLDMFGGPTPGILLRCFLLNGVPGYVFGSYYRKYGIQYAMLAHMGCHIVSKLIWAVFILR